MNETSLGRLTISVIVPAYNEESIIGRTLERIHTAVEPHELLVVNAGSTDRTEEIAADLARVLTVRMTRGAGLNHAASLATGDVLLFLHADTLLPASAASHIESALRDPKVAGGAFRLQLDDPGFLARVVSRSANLRSSLLNTFFGDQALFVRREIFIATGGYRDWSLMEDLEILSRLRRHGRLVLLDAEVLTSARRHRGRGWLRTIMTVWALSLLSRLGVPAHRLARLYRPQR